MYLAHCKSEGAISEPKVRLVYLSHCHWFQNRCCFISATGDQVHKCAVLFCVYVDVSVDFRIYFKMQ